MIHRQSGPRAPALVAWLATILLLAVGRPTLAQERTVVSPLVTAAPAATTPAVPSADVINPPAGHFAVAHDLLAPLPRDFRNLASWRNVWLAGAGAAGALSVHGWDQRVAEANWGGGTVRRALEPGRIAGDTMVQSGAALALYAIGRSTHKPGLATLGADLFRAQVVAQGTTQAIKFASRRMRPDGTSLSFPSGHTASAFAMATVLQDHFGWKAGVPAYLAAAWVGASRIQDDRHFVSDVVAGAVVGLTAGRSVTIGRGRAQFSLEPVVIRGGVGVSIGRVRH